MKGLKQYNSSERDIMLNAEAAKNKQLDRVDEIIAFASLSGIKKIKEKLICWFQAALVKISD